ncbi:hypothetical protein Taro_000439 [Colocasia esculenta]|uniref:Uncharacterized protein n=1 Tax=Colocasia esculenta TaxID=4460 RepID=A0A843TC02_COLES|nr:hypothetical protein [Colocasia esculenta]
MTSVWGSSVVLWHLCDVLEREWLSRRLVRRLEMLRHLSRRSLYHRTRTVALFLRRHLLLRPELRQALIVARVTDLDAAYQTATALEADTLQTRARSAEVQTQVVPTQPQQQQGSVQTTLRTTTSYTSTSTGTTAKSGSRRKFRRDRRQAEQRQQSIGSVQQPVTWREIVLCYLVCRNSRPSHSPECSSSSSSRHPCSNVSRPEILVGREALVRVAVIDRAGNTKIWCDSRGDFEGFRRDWWVVVDSRSRRV